MEKLGNIAVVGSGVAGLSAAHFLEAKGFEVTVYESGEKPGGLIKCDVVEGNLYHRVGGHVFNSKMTEVLDWFWSFFDRDEEFLKARRNACISLKDGQCVGYPIENHLYQMPKDVVQAIIADLVEIAKNPNPGVINNFDDFLLQRFGPSLYNLYFKPYNTKIWQCDLRDIPLEWLEGKLPMPSVEEIVLSNVLREGESNMVHSHFYYSKENGSQFIADRLARGLNIIKSTNVSRITPHPDGEGFYINENEHFDKVVFTGNLRKLGGILGGDLLGENLLNRVAGLEYHGTTTVLCNIEPNPYSWVYLPDPSHRSHRMICTGNFAPSNNASNRLSATVEFSAEVSLAEIEETLLKLPFNPVYIDHTFTPYTYPIHRKDSREVVQEVKKRLSGKGFYLLGRFAEWEYYNMDTAIAAAMKLADRLG